MTVFFSSLLLCSLTGSTAYLLLKLLLLPEGGRLSQSWRCRAGTAAALLFLLPLYQLWHLLPKAPAAPLGVSAAAAPTSGGAQFQWADLLHSGALLWCVIAGGLLLWDLCCLLRFRRQAAQAKPLADGPLADLAQAEARALGLRQPVRLYSTPAVSSPMLVGYFRPVLLLPQGTLSPEDARLVFSHELHHFRRGDLWKKLLAETLCLLHWFNPIAHLLKRDLLYWMETACDEAVVRPLDFAQRKQYGCLLIDGASPTRPWAREPSVSFAPSRKTLERRISTMLHTNHAAHTVLGGVMAMALAAGCLVTTAFAADLSKEAPVETEKSASYTITSETTPASDAEAGVFYTVTSNEDGLDFSAKDFQISLNGSKITLDDLKDLGNGKYEVMVDGEPVTIVLSMADDGDSLDSENYVHYTF